jgi:hypothetical protein
VRLYGADVALLGRFTAPVTGDNGKAVVATDAGAVGAGTPGVVQVEVVLEGKSGLDDVVFGVADAADGGPVMARAKAEEAELEAAAAALSATLSEAVPTAYALEPAYPNPFNPETVIGYALPEAAVVHLAVYDVLGRAVARLVDGPVAAGRHRAVFDGSGVPSGVYVVRLVAGSYVEVRQVVLAK